MNAIEDMPLVEIAAALPIDGVTSIAMIKVVNKATADLENIKLSDLEATALILDSMFNGNLKPDDHQLYMDVPASDWKSLAGRMSDRMDYLPRKVVGGSKNHVRTALGVVASKARAYAILNNNMSENIPA